VAEEHRSRLRLRSSLREKRKHVFSVSVAKHGSLRAKRETVRCRRRVRSDAAFSESAR
jgi:hypothetical protein